MKLRYKPDALLLLIFLVCVSLLTYCYPTVQLTNDSFYYLAIANEIKPSLRPFGYPLFLNFLGGLNKSFLLIAASQYCMYFASIWCLLSLIDRFFKLTTAQYILLGVLLIVEPVGLYHCFNVLSDVLFSALTLGYIITLLLCIMEKKRWMFALHLIIMYASIEVRHIALFYPFFSFVILVFFNHKLKPVLTYAITIFGIYFLLHWFHIKNNQAYYGAPVYTPFAGWTHANNSLYGLHLVKLSPADISDPEIRALHNYFTHYMDTSGYYPQSIGSGFLWDDKSPLCLLRQKIQDSLQLTFVEAWYKLAPAFSKYGIYMQKHFPLEYFKGYMVPNIATLIAPHDGEMIDYFSTPGMNIYVLEWFHKKPSDFHVRKQIYHEHINYWNTKYYQLRLALFILASAISLFFYKRIGRKRMQVIIPLSLFVYGFYLLTWYSSWFMQRYMIPVFPLEIIVLFLTCTGIYRKKNQIT